LVLLFQDKRTAKHELPVGQGASNERQKPKGVSAASSLSGTIDVNFINAYNWRQRNSFYTVTKFLGNAHNIDKDFC
jgi:hypothetical protein